MRTRIIVLAGVMALSGCALQGPAGGTAGAAPALAANGQYSRTRLIVADFVAAMQQLPATAANSGALHAAPPANRFGELMLAALQRAGYDLRIGPEEQAPRWLDFTAHQAALADAQGASLHTFVVSVGSVKLRRDYVVNATGVVPGSSLFVHGADASALVVNDSRFNLAQERSGAGSGRVLPASLPPSPPPPQPVGIEAPILTPVPRAPLIKAYPDVAPEPEPLARNALEDFSGADIGQGGSARNRPNLYESRRSSYAEQLEDYTAVARHTLVFGNDSLMMSADHKALVRQLVEQYKPGDDLFSVIGCSQGPTSLVSGNRSLALGRAQRVKDELIQAGIAADRILDEGCWAASIDPSLPARGVVLTHLRRPSPAQPVDAWAGNI